MRISLELLTRQSASAIAIQPRNSEIVKNSQRTVQSLCSGDFSECLPGQKFIKVGALMYLPYTASVASTFAKTRLFKLPLYWDIKTPRYLLYYLLYYLLTPTLLLCF